ncbi:unnamed protein product [Paramecium sonneborni]|uniref:Uncharacterized protein n=1 Tax=Paramecium sonneborni TaxID=65129 RepID=A0A8S1NRA6_9CILI|nr:unnamed protein product [Paramecium sonneborni]
MIQKLDSNIKRKQIEFVDYPKEKLIFNDIWMEDDVFNYTLNYSDRRRISIQIS